MAGKGPPAGGAAGIDRGSPSQDGPALDEVPNPDDYYCAVTVVCGHRRLDLALPTTVSCSELLPGLLRLVNADNAPAPAHPWGIVPIGRGPLAGSETLMEAGVLAGDVLMLQQTPNPAGLGAVVANARDRIDDVMSDQRRFWDPHAARSLVQWVALITGAALLLPAAHLRTGPVPAAMSATIAGITALTAILSHRRSETVCATVGLTLSCAWAGLAGIIAFCGWTGAAPVGAVPVGLMALLVALGLALLLAGCAAASIPAALIHATALMVIAIACTGAVVAIIAGARAIDVFSVGPLVAVLLLGGLPRLALATGGLVGGGPGGDIAELDHRIDRADRVLVGCLIGVSVVTAGAVSPAALAGDGGPRLLAVGIGLLLLLRSRAYSQARHVLAPRTGGLLVLSIVWLGVYLDDALPRVMLISGVALAAAVWVVGFDVLERTSSPVALARRARFLDAAEQVLVVVLILGMAWVVVLDEWVVSVVN